MKRYLIICAALLGVSFIGHAQVGIGTKKPSASAMLEIVAKDKGVLIPRVALTNLTSYSPITGSSTDPNVVGLLVYNTNSSLNVENPTSSQGFYYWTGEAWNRIASTNEILTIINNNNSQSTGKIEELTSIINNLIKNQGSTTSVILYDSSTKEFYTLVEKDGKIIKEKIDIGEAILALETKTFVRPVYEKPGDEKSKVVNYIYFGEEAIAEWLKKEGNKLEDITDDRGFVIDVIGTVSNNFQTIFNENKEEITNILHNVEGNVSIIKEGDTWIIKVGDGEGNNVNFDFNLLETKTYLTRNEVLEDGKKPEAKKPITLDEAKLTKGQIYYEYFGEKKDDKGNPIPYYIDMTSDVYNTIKNNENIKNEINNIITNFNKEGGNVYYGDHDGQVETPDVLYTIQPDNSKKILHLGQTLKEIFTNESTLLTEIREGLGYNITSEVKHTGNKLEGNSILIYSGVTTIKELDADTSGVSLPIPYQGKKIEVVDIALYNSNKQLEKVGITDIDIKGDKIDFALGSGVLYTTLPAGSYKVVVQFVEAK